ncbi:hypothetical protein GII30_21250 [Gordonia amarae]|uniref:Uncharacterized protein n=2 Tax=Gordonia amarae TaxID=36821 RepID=G7GWA3_9ACTN|nr:hypothetical protein [Gordonia amarae]MCS3880974.1 hypothetical protein [Gordonia amarae]QHN19215.1 hypothetical protein GII35_21545 [Gordonia amarae]QHN23691.1 hypothetical protein GII34_21045 [Gordonia amarae]QHN32603.1 hypothetical protein GII32_21375 [Gordonia amarae]QHN41351.1 hypothetical protein GII30_21250 [Gordonia amarae]
MTLPSVDAIAEKTVHLAGTGDNRSSYGNASVSITDDGQVWINIPDRHYGHAPSYNLTRADAERFLAALQSVMSEVPA